LLLPSIATWWCGQAKEQRYVNDHLAELVVKPAFAGQTLSFSTSDAPTGRRKLAGYRKDLVRLIQVAPRDFVAQERLKLSKAPAWAEDHLTALPVVLRAYMANGRDSIAVLPGGLARISKNANDVVVSM